jgi:transcription initiation factor TFIIIB Brf1 subunit/transcription initiation factor TFIIB
MYGDYDRQSANDPYDTHECDHSQTYDRKGEIVCKNCGAVYNESTLEWEANNY